MTIITISVTLALCSRVIHEEPAGPVVLDYKKIRADLVLGGDHLQALLLQALRWVSFTCQKQSASWDRMDGLIWLPQACYMVTPVSYN